MPKYTQENLLIKKLELYSRHSTRIFMNKFCGAKLGSGVYRKVYELHNDKRFVVKIQTSPAFENQLEHKIWHEVKGNYWYNRWFAQVLWMNDKGTILVMRRARPIKNENARKLKEMRIPHFFKDIHAGNYGWIGKRFVCFDYGNSLVTEGWNLNRMKKLKWS